MAADYNYLLTRWEWAADGLGNAWMPPAAGPVGWIDLRPIPAQAQAGGVAEGWLFGAFTGTPSGVLLAAATDFREFLVSAAQRDAWATALGYRPTGDTLRDCLWSQLTTGADPTGDAGPKPLMPTRESVLELIVPGHPVVRREKFRWGHHPHTNRVQAVLHRQYREILSAPALYRGDDQEGRARRRLDYWRKKFGLTRTDEWRVLVPPELRAGHPGPLPHRTAYADSFDGADSDTMGVDLTWTETNGDFDISSNQAVGQADGAEARADHDLDGDDHMAEALAVSGAQPCICARFSASARTFYFTRADSLAGGRAWILKSVSGTRSVLASTSGTGGPNGKTHRLECDGSGLDFLQNGGSVLSTTDTSITGNTRGGLRAENAACTFDDFAMADLASIADLTFDADGTIAAEVVHDAGTGSPFYTHCNDAPDGVSTDWVANDQSETTTTAWFRLSDVPADFDAMVSAKLSFDGDATGFSDDTATMTARIFDADNDTTNPLCDESANMLTDADSTRVQRTVALQNLTGTKAQWNSAYCRLTWTYTQNAGPDNAQLRLYGTLIEYSYTAAGAEPGQDQPSFISAGLFRPRRVVPRSLGV